MVFIQILSLPSETASPEASLRAALSRATEKSTSATEICQLLCSVHRSFPGLQPVLRELAHTGEQQAGGGSRRAPGSLPYWGEEAAVPVRVHP